LRWSIWYSRPAGAVERQVMIACMTDWPSASAPFVADRDQLDARRCLTGRHRR
jgi:hypothetical protein